MFANTLFYDVYQPVILDYLASKMLGSNDLVVVSPDVGGVARARTFAKKSSDAPLAIVDKRRHGHNLAEVISGRESLPSCCSDYNAAFLLKM